MSKELIELLREARHLIADGYGKQLYGDPYVSASLERIDAALAQPAAPASQVERWNIERDGDALLVCFNDHEKGAGCRYQRFVPAQPASPAESKPAQAVPLTDEQVEHKWLHFDEPTDYPLSLRDFELITRAVERAHGIVAPEVKE